jgi:prepilin-type N-terminal cleavage/methylation domain-containing protein
MLIRPRSKKAFTLLELIVVIVILGLLAALAIPTFARVTKKSQDASTSATISAVLRDARALRAFEPTSTEDWKAVTETAVGETTAPSASGLLAAAMTSRSATVSDTEPTSTSEAVYSLLNGGVVVSMLSRSGNVCLGAASLASTTTVTCAPPRTDKTSSAKAVGAGGTMSDGSSFNLPVGASSPAPASSSALAAPTSVVATAGDATASVTWAAVPGATNYVVTPSSGAAAKTVSALKADFIGLANGTPVTFSVVAKASGSADSSAGVSNSVTPAAARVLYSASVADGPMSFYALNDAAGSSTAQDTSGANRNATAVGAVFGSGGQNASTTSARLSSSSSITLPGAAAPTSGAVSIEAWVNPSSGTDYAIAGRFPSTFANGYILAVSGGKLDFEAYTSPSQASRALSTSALPVNSWHHVAVTYDGVRDAKVYIDGVLNSSTTMAYSGYTSPSVAPTIGVHSASSAYNFPGRVSGVGFYGKVLTAAQVQAHYESGR